MKTRSKVIIFSIIVGLAISVVLGVYLSSNLNNNTKNMQSEDDAIKARYILQNYVGKDGVGDTIQQVIAQTILHDNETLTQEPTWETNVDFNSRSTVYTINGKFPTSDGLRQYHFTVDLNDNSISANNNLASDILKLVN